MASLAPTSPAVNWNAVAARNAPPIWCALPCHSANQLTLSSTRRRPKVRRRLNSPSATRTISIDGEGVPKLPRLENRDLRTRSACVAALATTRFHAAAISDQHPVISLWCRAERAGRSNVSPSWSVWQQGDIISRPVTGGLVTGAQVCRYARLPTPRHIKGDPLLPGAHPFQGLQAISPKPQWASPPTPVQCTPLRPVSRVEAWRPARWNGGPDSRRSSGRRRH